MSDILVPSRRRGSLHDQVFKVLFGTFLPDLVTLVAPETAARCSVERLNQIAEQILVARSLEEMELR